MRSMRSVLNPLGSLVLPALAGLVLTGMAAGCARKAPPPGPARVEVPPRDWEPPVREREQIKPLPGMPEEEVGVGDVPPPPFDDVPLVSQRTPEQRAFVEAYESVGRPRIMVFVSGGAATGRRDELDVADIDYESAENILSDWFAAEGRVDLLSPTERERLGRQEAQNLQSDRPQRDRAGGADIIVRVRAQQTRQSREGDAIRLVAEAVNTDDGRQLGRSVVDVPPPIDKPQLNKYTRFVARRLMDQMTRTWRAPGPDRGRAGEQDREFREPPGAAPDRDAGAGGGPASAADATMREVEPAPAPVTRRAAPTTRPTAAPDPREPSGPAANEQR